MNPGEKEKINRLCMLYNVTIPSQYLNGVDMENAEDVAAGLCFAIVEEDKSVIEIFGKYMSHYEVWIDSVFYLDNFELLLTDIKNGLL